MSAQSMDTFVLAFSDPALDAPDTQRGRVNSSISFELLDDQHIRTLSTNNGGGDIEGLLYVPNLHPSDPCVNASAHYVPINVTRLADLPTTDYLYVAFAPWLSASCTKSYLAAAQGVTAFLFYVPDGGNSTPPLANDETWDLDDGGRWKSQNKFPVYALPGIEGAAVMQQLGIYSGNSSDPTNLSILAGLQFDPTDYVRVYTSFATNGSSNLPTLWAFLLIVLGVVLLLIGATSFLMHYFQRRNRADLQRRVDAGEVDLEILGIKRTRIRQEVIETIPTCIYVPSDDLQPLDEKKEPSTPSSLSYTSEAATSTLSNPKSNFYDQRSCIICSEDFIPNTTSVRCLPCHHIYHPECIDPWLASNSSLCPVCKASALPSSSSYRFTEPVTNAMVRHERHARRIREDRERARSRINSAIGDEGDPRRLIAGLRRGVERGRRVFSAPSATLGAASELTRSQIEMRAVGSRAVSSPLATVGSPAIAGPEGRRGLPADATLRREWMRRRFSTLRGNALTAEDEEMEREARRPKWRRAVGTIFPGFR